MGLNKRSGVDFGVGVGVEVSVGSRDGGSSSRGRGGVSGGGSNTQHVTPS